jgi:hypothetical protein
MLIKITRIDPDGRYSSTSYCDSETLQYEDVPHIYIGHADLKSQYHNFDTGLPEDIPPQPTPNHTFNHATKQWEPDPTFAANKAKAQRAQLLLDSDWTQLPDVPLATKEAWAVYRQALRDITLQAGYPLAIDWPLAP